MSRIKGKIAFLAALFIFAGALIGCSVRKSDSSRLPPSPREVELDIENMPSEPVRHPLVIISKRMQEAGCTVSYPFVCDEGMALLNRSITKAFTEFASDCESPGCTVRYTVEFNRYGLLSLSLTGVTKEGRTLLTDTANFDADSGERVFLSDCFGENPGDYASSIKELVAKSVDDRGFKLLSYQPDVDDGTQFLFAYGGLYVLYREYELFTYDAGAPRISITLDELADCIQPDGLLNRLSSAAD